MEPLKCPSCGKEIKQQAEIQIPNAFMHPTSIVHIKLSDQTVTYGSLVFKNGKRYLVIETVCKCPHCETFFPFDAWLELAFSK